MLLYLIRLRGGRGGLRQVLYSVYVNGTLHNVLQRFFTFNCPHCAHVKYLYPNRASLVLHVISLSNLHWINQYKVLFIRGCRRVCLTVAVWLRPKGAYTQLVEQRGPKIEKSRVPLPEQYNKSSICTFLSRFASLVASPSSFGQCGLHMYNTHRLWTNFCKQTQTVLVDRLSVIHLRVKQSTWEPSIVWSL